MSWLDKHFKLFSTPDFILNVGAGQANHLPAMVVGSDTRLILVEPEPLLAATLLKATDKADRISVLNCALSEADGLAELCVHDFSELNTLYPETSAFSLLPSLTYRSRVTVKTMTLAGLAEEGTIWASGRNWLIVETPAMEQTVLSGLRALAHGPSFDHVILSVGGDLSDRSSFECKGLLSDYLELGYQMIGDIDTIGATWPRMHLQYSPELDELSLTRRKLTSQNETLENLKTELHRRLASETAELEEQKQELEQQLQAAEINKAELEEQKQELEQQLQAAEINKAELEERHQQGEQSLKVAIDNLARANAQIDLIKDMLHVEPAT